MTNISIVNFNSGELAPETDARGDIEKYPGGCRRCENMIPEVYGDATKRPGTEFITIGYSGFKAVVDILAKYKLVSHAAGSNYVTQSNDTPQTTWSTGTDNNALSADVDKHGYTVICQYMTTVDGYSPLLLFNRDGVNQGVDFTFSTVLGDVKNNVSSNRDCVFSPDGTHIYYVQYGPRVHAYNRDGTRDWRLDIDDISAAGMSWTIAIDENGYLYIPAGENKKPLKLDPSDGSTLIEYSHIYTAVENGYDSCVSMSNNKVYITGQANTVAPGGEVIIGLDMDTNNVISWSSIANSSGRYICTDNTNVYVAGLGGSFTGNTLKKFDCATLTLQDETNIAGPSALWIAFDGSLAVATGLNQITYLDISDLSVISTYTVDDNIGNSTGLGKTRRESYYGWSDALDIELVIYIPDHGFETGWTVTFTGVGGATELNGNTYEIVVMDDDYFYLVGTDYSDFSEYTSGGSVFVKHH
jgi:hypothetical protein